MCGAIMICVLFAAAASAEKGSSSPAANNAEGSPRGDEGLESTQSAQESNESGDQASCPLCSEKFPNQDRLESHAMSVHSVNSEGLQRLQSLINGSHWLNKKEGN